MLSSFSIKGFVFLFLLSGALSSQDYNDAIERARQAKEAAAANAAKEARRKMARELGLEIPQNNQQSRYEKISRTERDSQINKISLPRIPIYTEQDSLILFNDDSPFILAGTRNDAFIELEINKSRSYFGISPGLRYALTLIVGAYGFQFYAKEDPIDSEGPYFFGGWLASSVFGLFPFLGGEESARKTAIYKIGYGTPGNLNSATTIKVKSEGRIWSNPISCGIWALFGPYSWMYYINGGKGYDKSKIKLPIAFNSSNFNIKEFSNYMKLHELVLQYNELKIDDYLIRQWLKNSLSKLGKPKGEFESTNEYQRRLIKERESESSIREQVSEKRYDLQIKLHEKKEKLFEKIQRLSKTAIFERDLEFKLSSYDADRESFMINIPSLGMNRELFVERKNAPRFKANKSNLRVKEILIPSLDGEWIPAKDDVILYDNLKRKSISW